MKFKSAVIAVCLVLAAAGVNAHHAAEGTIDEDLYVMIDEMVTDTPHADLVFDDVGIVSTGEADAPEGYIVFTITFQSVKWFQYLVDKDLMLYLSMLSGEVTADLAFDYNGAVILTVTHIPDATSD